ncbi:AMP-binding protein [Streptococcus oralis subsp. dentisani]|uniref:AMP-binding protein n=1 Tax=Streptococcus oralis subsp. dentisani TaxID=1458253 RepID=A0A2I1UCT9_STROR|nr:non-ribosomal peptide synthetase [Streptococcus oralis]PLA03703.1 AMP-binding protein [Streptococcus oralis subsp. dentisani]
MIEMLMDMLGTIRETDPSRTAIKDNTRVLSYCEVDTITNIVANQIVRKIGVNQRVAVILPHGINQILAMIAILKSNNCYVPIDYSLNGDKIKKIYSSTQAVMYISDKNIPYVSKTNFLDVSEFITKKSDEKLPIENPFIYLREREAYILHTSGSTGEPKGVIVSIANLDYIIRNLNTITPAVEESRYLFSTPYSFDVSITEMLGWIVSGSSVYCLDLSVPSNYKCLAEIIFKNKITHLAFSPAAFLAFIERLEQPILQKLDSTIKYVVIAGEKFNLSIYRLWKRNKLNFKLINAYGPTETTIYATAHIITKDETEDIPIGVPLEGVKYIIKSNGTHNYGELYIGGKGVSKGYTNTSLNNERFPVIDGDRYYSTGDIVYYKNGSLYYVGRKDNQIQRNGIRIELGEIEKGIESNSKVIQVLVLQIEKQIVAFYTGYISPQNLKRFCLKNISKYMIPNSFIKVEQFPMTVNRKIDKTFLKEIFKERNQNNLVSAADYNNLSDDEVQILKLVSKKLNISITKLDISKDFFENGGDSLSLFTFILDLEDYYGVSIPMDDIYGKKLYDLIRELKGNIKRKLHVEKTDNLLDMRNEDFYSKTEIKFLYDSYLRNNNKVISKFQAIHCQRIYYYDNYRNILTSTFEYKNCSIEKIKSVVQQVIASNSLLHSKISVDEKRMDFEIVKPNLDIPVLKVSNQSELTYLEDLLEDVGEDMIPTSRNQGGQLAMPIIISNGLNGKIIIQMDHSISDLSSISIIKKQIGRLVSGIEDTLTNDENYKYYCEKIREINKKDSLEKNQYHHLLLKESKKIKHHTKFLSDTLNSLSIIHAPDYSNIDSILYISFKISKKLCKASGNSTLIIFTIFNNRDLKALNLQNTIGDCHSSKYLIYREEDTFEEYKKRNFPLFISEDDNVIYYRPGFIFNEFYPNVSNWRQEIKKKLASISLVSLNFIGIISEQKKKQYLDSFSDISEFLGKHPRIYITSFRYKNQFYILSNKKIDL